MVGLWIFFLFLLIGTFVTLFKNENLEIDF